LPKSPKKAKLSQPSESKNLLLELIDNIHIFFSSNGESLEIQFDDEDEPVEKYEDNF
jgi:hypothetical protein